MDVILLILLSIYSILIEEEDMEPDSFEQDCFNFMESPLLNVNLQSQDNSDSLKEFPLRLSAQQGLSMHQPSHGEAGTRRLPKIQKEDRIRTSRNAQKTYHIILKQWLQRQKYTSILPKYNKYFNQRVYFILVLDEITKQIDGELFMKSYEQLAQEVIEKKTNQICRLDRLKQHSEQALHLSRLIEEIKYSIKACREFVAGNVLDALEIVYKRDQKRITKIKEFEKAIGIFRDVTGHDPENF